MPGYADTRLPGESERGGGGSKKRDFRKDESGPALSLSPMKRQYEPCPVIAEYELKGGVRVRNLNITLPEGGGVSRHHSSAGNHPALFFTSGTA